MKLAGVLVVVGLALTGCKGDSKPPAADPPAPAPAAAPVAETPPTPAPTPPPPPAPDAEEKRLGQCKWINLKEAADVFKTPTRFILNESDMSAPCRIGSADKTLGLEVSMDLSGAYAPEVIKDPLVADIGEKASWDAETPEDPALFFQVGGKVHRIRASGARDQTLKDETIALAKIVAANMAANP